MQIAKQHLKENSVSARTTQHHQKKNNPVRKMGRRPKQTFPQRRHAEGQ